ncbi:glutathione S-transferase 2-like [Plodia interpunctella]|uniref:glutathione S-transferase 2-like n=1 Tax=Plodia interpunctella TaxID=58824 RepID=UPI00236830B6|nr:glutathione S-transferase 2-like [Plodia interpunctella]
MPKVEFYYFQAKALGEGARMLLAYGGQEFKDIRIPDNDWPQFKPKTPYGMMPYMIIDGKIYTQCTAMCRYLGRKYGLSGADIEEDFEIDQIVELIQDIRAKGTHVRNEENPEVKAKRHAEYTKDQYPLLLKKLDDGIRNNNGYLVAGKLTWADFFFAGIYDFLKGIMEAPQLDEKYPSFKKLQQTVVNLPGVKEYVAKAPHCDE